MPVKAMEHTITQNDPNVVATNGVAATPSDIYVYTCPRHTAVQLRPEDILSALLKDAVPAELADTDQFRLLIKDPNGLTEEVLAQGDYVRMKEFTDRNKVLRLGTSKLLKSDYQLILEVTSATQTPTVANCSFQITCLRYAEVL